MSDELGGSLLSGSVLDELLQRTPLHIFLFDRMLSCRYAAPVGGAFLGLRREQLLGRAVTEILPPAGNGLHAALQRVAVDGLVWQHPHYRYSHQTVMGEVLSVWSIQAEQVAIRAGEDERGVLLILQDLIDCVREQERLQHESDELRAALVVERQRAATQRRARHELHTAIRNLLAPASGYLQVLARKPGVLRGWRVRDVIEEQILPRLNDIAAALDQFDDSASDPARRG